MTPVRKGYISQPGQLSQAWDGTGTTPVSDARAVSLIMSGNQATVGVEISGTFVADLVPEATITGTVWTECRGEDCATGLPAEDILAPGSYRFDVAGFAQFRLRCAAYTSGIANVALLATTARANLFPDLVAAVNGVNASLATAARQYSYTAGATISGHSIVRLAGGLAYPADAATDSATTLQSVVGMAVGAAQAGATVQVVRLGPVPGLAGLNPSVPYFLGAAGAITTTRPTTGTLLIVGSAQDDQTFSLRISVPVALS